MLVFNPPELSSRIAQAIQKLAKLINDPNCDFVEDGFNPGGTDFAPDEYDDICITAESTLTIGLPRVDESHELSYGELIELADELEGAKLVANVECWTRKRFLLRVEPVLMESHITLGHFPRTETPKGLLQADVQQNGKTITCSLVDGYTPFAFLVTAQGYWDKYYAPVLDDDLFIQVSWEGPDHCGMVEEIVAAYRFELASSLGVELRPSPRAVEYDELLQEAIDSNSQPPHLRQLLVGKGMSGVLDLYNRATSESDQEVRLLYLTRVFEYISRTVVRLQLTEVVRAKLLSRRALDPSADFILEVEALFEEQSKNKRDREAIVLTVISCCEATELSVQSPRFLKKLREVTASSKRKDQEEALRVLGESLVATRNSIAHAKANYTPTGDECPPDQLSQFVGCVKVAAQQAIRWYANRPDSLRVC